MFDVARLCLNKPANILGLRRASPRAVSPVPADGENTAPTPATPVSRAWPTSGLSALDDTSDDDNAEPEPPKLENRTNSVTELQARSSTTMATSATADGTSPRSVIQLRSIEARVHALRAHRRIGDSASAISHPAQDKFERQLQKRSWWFVPLACRSASKTPLSSRVSAAATSDGRVPFRSLETSSDGNPGSFRIGRH